MDITIPSTLFSEKMLWLDLKLAAREVADEIAESRAIVIGFLYG